MRRSYLIAIVVAGAALIVFAIVFLILRNPYEVINPPPETSPTLGDDAPTTETSITRELITVRETPTLGASVGVDGVRLVFTDLPTSTLRVAEYDGTGEQALSDTFSGVSATLLAPTRDRALVQVANPDAPALITLLYDLRTRDAVRLEDGIVAFDWSPDGGSVVYYVQRDGTPPSIRVAPADGGEPTILRDNFSLVDPVLDWYDASHVAFWQSPNSTRSSPIVSISTDGQESFELAASAPAQQALFSPDGASMLVSSNDPVSGKPVVALGDVSSGELTQLPLITWIDKCTWSVDGSQALCFAPSTLPAGFTYPDDNRDQSYHDQLWTVAASSGETKRVYDVPESIPDAAEPFTTDDLSRLNFLDRARGALVSLDLAGKVVPATPTTKPEEANES